MRYRTGSIEPTDHRGADAPLRFVASTESIAADGGVLYASGWDLARFHGTSGYGPWLWSHDYSALPIGRVKARVEGRQLIAEVWPDLADPLGAEVARKYKNAFLRDVSVGFRVITPAPANQVPIGATWASVRHELLDLSAVVVGSDAEATILRSLATTTGDARLRALLEGILDRLDARIRADDAAYNRQALLGDLAELTRRLRR